MGDVTIALNDTPLPVTGRRVSAVEPFESVLERHGPAVLRFCVARLGPDRGEEAFQETLLAALRHCEDLRDRGAVGPWLFSIAQRKIVDSARSFAPLRWPLTSSMSMPAAWSDPDATDDVWSRVAALPPKQREAVALRYLADLPYGDIAEAMGTTADAARRNVFEGLNRLRRDLADDAHNL